MIKPMAAALAALVIAGSSMVYAQQHSGDPDTKPEGGARIERHHWSVDDAKAFADAKIAALKAGLALTADQERNWPAFEQAVRGLLELRIQDMQARQARKAAGEQQQPVNPFNRLQHWADAMSARSVALKHLAVAGAPLYDSLDDAQKRRFKVLARMLRSHHHSHEAMGHEDMGHKDMDHGWREGHGHDKDSDRDDH